MCVLRISLSDWIDFIHAVSLPSNFMPAVVTQSQKWIFCVQKKMTKICDFWCIYRYLIQPDLSHPIIFLSDPNRTDNKSIQAKYTGLQGNLCNTIPPSVILISHGVRMNSTHKKYIMSVSSLFAIPKTEAQNCTVDLAAIQDRQEDISTAANPQVVRWWLMFQCILFFVCVCVGFRSCFHPAPHLGLVLRLLAIVCIHCSVHDLYMLLPAVLLFCCLTYVSLFPNPHLLMLWKVHQGSCVHVHAFHYVQWLLYFCLCS